MPPEERIEVPAEHADAVPVDDVDAVPAEHADAVPVDDVDAVPAEHAEAVPADAVPADAAPADAADADGRTIDDYSSRVLDVVDAIPPGQVMSYGDVAEYLGEGGPRQVGRVLSRYGGAAPWWRVTHADGTPAPEHDAAALPHYLAERTPLRSLASPVRVDMREARWRPSG